MFRAEICILFYEDGGKDSCETLVCAWLRMLEDWQPRCVDTSPCTWRRRVWCQMFPACVPLIAIPSLNLADPRICFLSISFCLPSIRFSPPWRSSVAGGAGNRPRPPPVVVSLYWRAWLSVAAPPRGHSIIIIFQCFSGCPACWTRGDLTTRHRMTSNGLENLVSLNVIEFSDIT
jgi:hypothetical protein